MSVLVIANSLLMVLLVAAVIRLIRQQTRLVSFISRYQQITINLESAISKLTLQISSMDNINVDIAEEAMNEIINDFTDEILPLVKKEMETRVRAKNLEKLLEQAKRATPIDG